MIAPLQAPEHGRAAIIDATPEEIGGPRLRPVFSPHIPDRDLRLLLAHRQVLLPADSPAPPRLVSWQRRPLTNLKVIFHLQLLTGLVFFVGMIIVGPAFGAPGIATVGTLALAADLVATGWFAVACGRESPALRAARRHHGEYLCPEDFDVESRELLLRAQQAADFVLSSRVNAEGLLDDLANAVVLPDRLWDIAGLLRDQTKLRARQQATTDAMMTPELQAVLTPQRRALDQSMAAVTRQIETLEVYAHRVGLAESAYQVQRLMQDNDDYLELLARTDDESALSDLTQRARQVETMLTSSLNDAIETGLTLTDPAPA